MTVYWHCQGNSQEHNTGGTGYAAGYVKKYQAVAPVSISLIDSYLTDGQRWPFFKSQQSTVLANLVPGSLNVLSVRAWAIDDSDFSTIYGDSVNNWADDVQSVMQAYLNAGMRICLISSIPGPTTPASRRHGMDAKMKSWVGTYIHGLADMTADAIMSDDNWTSHTTEFSVPDGHMHDAGQDLVLSYFQPAMANVVRPSWFSRA